jgi:hypothetical protein
MPMMQRVTPQVAGSDGLHEHAEVAPSLSSDPIFLLRMGISVLLGRPLMHDARESRVRFLPVVRKTQRDQDRDEYRDH